MKSWPLSNKIQLVSALCVLLLFMGVYLCMPFYIHIILLVSMAGVIWMGVVTYARHRTRLSSTHQIISGGGVLLTIVLFLWCGLGAALSLMWPDAYGPKMRFDAEVWRQSEGELSQWPPRLCMVDHLIRSRKLKGLTRHEVIELLGEPTETAYFRHIQEAGGIIYYLGPERGAFRIDSEWLFVKFNKADKVSAYGIVRD